MNLKKIRQSIIDDLENKAFTDQGWLPLYTAHKDAQIAIIGQAPGRLAQESAKPWNDKSGENLRSWLDIEDDVFYDETKVALIPMDFYFPGTGKSGDLPPRVGFADAWHPQIFAQMPNLQLIILVGQYAQKHYLGKDVKKTLTETVQNAENYLPHYFPLVHSSPRNNIWQAKNEWFKKQTIPLLQKTVNKIFER